VNKDLYNKTIELPKEIVEYLGTCFNHLPNSDSNTEGHNRNQELRNSGYVTYQQLGRIKNWFDNYDGDGTDAPYILNGADYMRDWVNNTLNGMRSIDSNKKQIKKDYVPDEIDGDMVKNLGPIADMLRPSKQHSTFVQDVKISENVNRINQIMKKII
jgi:hypothetical protein